MELKDIDINFDFQTDSYSSRNPTKLRDPDYYSKTLRHYHKLIYSKLLPNGQFMELTEDPYYYLKWDGLRFGSDSIIASFRYSYYQWMHDQLRHELQDYDKYILDYLHKAYTLGGEIIFSIPGKGWSMNQARGCLRKISDRFDLTLECIRRYYSKEDSPLSKAINNSHAFFDLFQNFQGYVEFFFLEDLCSSDFSKVNLWLDNDNFQKNALPQTPKEYRDFIKKELEFVKKRNLRISKFCNN